MKKKFVLFLIISILLISTIIYISPLSVWADVLIGTEGVWSLYSGNLDQPIISGVNNNARLYAYEYTVQSSWTLLSSPSTLAFTTQLPTPFSNLNSLTYSWSNCYGFAYGSVSRPITYLSFDFNGSFSSYIRQLDLHSGDYLCFSQLIQSRFYLSEWKFEFAKIVSGNSFEPLYTIEDRFLSYNPRNVPGAPSTSGIIDVSLWSSYPQANMCCYLFYFIIPFSDLLSLSNFEDISAITLSVRQTNSAASSSIGSYFYEPLLYKCSGDGSNLQILSSLDDIKNNVRYLADLLEDIDSSAWYNPPNLTSLSLDDMQALDNKFSINAVDDSIWQPIRNGFASREIINGLAFAGTLVTWVYDRLGFLTPIFGILLWLIILNALRGTIVSTMHKSDSEATFQKHREQMNEDREAYLKRWGK